MGKKEREAAVAKRKDAQLPNVIINETAGKKVRDKYLVEKAPFPFEGSKKLYERSLQQPLGNDWNASRAYDKSIKPKVQIRAGQIIEPMEPWEKDNANEERKNRYERYLRRKKIREAKAKRNSKQNLEKKSGKK